MATDLTVQGDSPMLPAFMQGDRTGTEMLGKYVVPPRLKVIQSTKGEAYEAFEPGDVVMTPTMVKLVGKGEPFFFVPVLFYPEFCVVNPIETKGTMPMIRERTTDIKSDIARRAMSPDENVRKEKCPDATKYDMSYVEYLVFISVLSGVPGMQSVPVSISFSKGERSRGSQLSALIKMRAAPIFGCVFQGTVPLTKRKNAKGEWYGIDVSNPDPSLGVEPFVSDEEDFATLRKLHDVLNEQYQSQVLRADLEEDDGVDAANAAAQSKF